MSKWINVHEKLPVDDYSLVLREDLDTNKRIIVIEHLSEFTNLNHTKPYRGSIFSKPIYWQPLPIIDI